MQVPGSDLRFFEIKDGILMRNHETSDFLSFCIFLLEVDCHQETWKQTQKKTLGMQMCGDLLWIKRESSKLRANDLQDLPQGDALHIIGRGAPSINQVEPLLVRFLPARLGFFGNVWIRSHDFWDKMVLFDFAMKNFLQ